jgi:CO/xanthine dehydrogenase Mo-binding subunit
MMVGHRAKLLVHVQSQNDAPGGIGEARLPPGVGPATANALATPIEGVRFRHYPFASNRVKAALRAAA